MNKDTVFITGYAKLPHGITSSELYKVIVVGVIVNKNTGVIEDVDCSLVTSVARKFVKFLITGENIRDYNTLAKKISERYHGSARKALMSAFKIINEKYNNLLEDS